MDSARFVELVAPATPSEAQVAERCYRTLRLQERPFFCLVLGENKKRFLSSLARAVENVLAHEAHFVDAFDCIDLLSGLVFPFGYRRWGPPLSRNVFVAVDDVQDIFAMGGSDTAFIADLISAVPLTRNVSCVLGATGPDVADLLGGTLNPIAAYRYPGYRGIDVNLFLYSPVNIS